MLTIYKHRLFKELSKLHNSNNCNQINPNDLYKDFLDKNNIKNFSYEEFKEKLITEFVNKEYILIKENKIIKSKTNNTSTNVKKTTKKNKVITNNSNSNINSNENSESSVSIVITPNFLDSNKHNYFLNLLYNYNYMENLYKDKFNNMVRNVYKAIVEICNINTINNNTTNANNANNAINTNGTNKNNKSKINNLDQINSTSYTEINSFMLRCGIDLKNIKNTSHYCKQLLKTNRIISEVKLTNNNEKKLSINNSNININRLDIINNNNNISNKNKEDSEDEDNSNDSSYSDKENDITNNISNENNNNHISANNDNDNSRSILYIRNYKVPYPFIIDKYNINNNIFFHLIVHDDGLNVKELSYLCDMKGREKSVGRIVGDLLKKMFIKKISKRTGKIFEYLYVMNDNIIKKDSNNNNNSKDETIIIDDFVFQYASEYKKLLIDINNGCLGNVSKNEYDNKADSNNIDSNLDNTTNNRNDINNNNNIGYDDIDGIDNSNYLLNNKKFMNFNEHDNTSISNININNNSNNLTKSIAKSTTTSYTNISTILINNLISKSPYYYNNNEILNIKTEYFIITLRDIIKDKDKNKQLLKTHELLQKIVEDKEVGLELQKEYPSRSGNSNKNKNSNNNINNEHNPNVSVCLYNFLNNISNNDKRKLFLDYVYIKLSQNNSTCNSSSQGLKSFSDISFNRLIYILNELYFHRVLSINDIKHLIYNILEKDKSYKIDRKTISNLLLKLEALGLVKLSKYEITMSNLNYKYINKDEVVQNKMLVMKLDVEETDDVYQDALKIITLSVNKKTSDVLVYGNYSNNDSNSCYGNTGNNDATRAKYHKDQDFNSNNESNEGNINMINEDMYNYNVEEDDKDSNNDNYDEVYDDNNIDIIVGNINNNKDKKKRYKSITKNDSNTNITNNKVINRSKIKEKDKSNRDLDKLEIELNENSSFNNKNNNNSSNINVKYNYFNYVNTNTTNTISQKDLIMNNLISLIFKKLEIKDNLLMKASRVNIRKAFSKLKNNYDIKTKMSYYFNNDEDDYFNNFLNYWNPALKYFNIKEESSSCRGSNGKNISDKLIMDLFFDNRDDGIIIPKYINKYCQGYYDDSDSNSNCNNNSNDKISYNNTIEHNAYDVLNFDNLEQFENNLLNEYKEQLTIEEEIKNCFIIGYEEFTQYSNRNNSNKDINIEELINTNNLLNIRANTHSNSAIYTPIIREPFISKSLVSDLDVLTTFFLHKKRKKKQAQESTINNNNNNKTFDIYFTKECLNSETRLLFSRLKHNVEFAFKNKSINSNIYFNDSNKEVIRRLVLLGILKIKKYKGDYSFSLDN